MSKPSFNTKLFSADDNAFISSITTHSDGTRSVFFRSGRRVLVPRGIRLFMPRDDFYDRLAAEVEAGFDEAGAPGLIDCVYGKDRRLYKILVAVADATVWVSANAPRDQLAVVAEFTDCGGYLQEVRAAAGPESYGNGVYPKILKSLRKHFDKPLHSDDTLSPQNVLVWMSRGSYTGKGYRINPRLRLTQRQVNAALALAASEVSLGELIA